MQPHDIHIGDRIGPYRIIGTLAGGGYRGMHDETSRRVHLEIAGRFEPFRDASMRMIETARILESLRHPGVARLVDRGVHADHRPWIAIEVPSGLGLYELIARRALPAREVAGLLHDLGDVLAHAHERGIVHGALTLRSIVLATGAREFPLCVSDWGLQRDDLGVYAAPELRDGRLDGRADVFALGVIAYRAAMQKFPAVPVKDVPALPPALAELVVRMLAIDPELRPTAAELRALSAELVSLGEDAVFRSLAAGARLGTEPPDELASFADDDAAPRPFDERVTITPGPRFAQPKWTPAPPITSDLASTVAGEIAEHTDRTEKLDEN